MSRASENSSQRPGRVVIQAGGVGSRLRPYTTVVPKPLMPVADMPILEIVIRQLAARGFTDVTITIGHLAHLIRSFFGDGSAFGAHIDYVVEDTPLGTIGPLTRVDRLDGPFLVMNGDLLTDIDYRRFMDGHVASDAPMTVAVCEKAVPISLGVIEFDGQRQVTGFQEKPVKTFSVSMGIYAMNREMLDHIPADTYFGFDDLMEQVIRREIPVRVAPFDGLWLDIGRHEDYEQASRVFEEHRDRFFG
ncbi:MAG: sugar phosphate nucleotidyltransferase [Planctomycetota bacterium]